MPHSDEVPARPATTVLLLRDGPAGIEVLMVERNINVAFVGGALVFPGGRVDAVDAAPAVLKHCRTVPGLSDGELAWCVAGIREAYEEAHVLLARPVGSEGLLSADALAALEARFPAVPTLADLLATGDIELATDLLVPFAHWVTPRFQKKRFDTRFYLAPAPLDQVPAHDGHEAVASLWMTPAAAIAASEARRVELIFVTKLNLLKLDRSATVAEALATARTAPIVSVCPELVRRPGGDILRIPDAADYGGSEFPAEGIPHM